MDEFVFLGIVITIPSLHVGSVKVTETSICGIELFHRDKAQATDVGGALVIFLNLVEQAKGGSQGSQIPSPPVDFGEIRLLMMSVVILVILAQPTTESELLGFSDLREQRIRLDLVPQLWHRHHL
jgi:hypothetical protein